MWITLRPEADPGEVRAALQGLGLWTQPLRGAQRGQVGFWVQPHSKAVAHEFILAVPGVAEVHAAPSEHPKVDAQAGRPVWVGDVAVGAGRPVLMAGPCSVESEAQIHEAARRVAQAGVRVLRGGVFKPRTSPYGFVGVGEVGLAWMREAADAHGLKVVTEVMSEAHVEAVAQRAELLQVGARNMQNFALLKAVGQAGRPVLLKRGMAAYVEDWLLAGEHLLAAGAPGVIFCERGVRNFDGSTRNLLDLGAVALLKHVHRQPVLVDPSHSAGRRDLIGPLSRAALAAGADGVIVEAHPDPSQARTDGPQALSWDELAALLET
jgi:3-deoxy-7-phosphoheptulonate synthase